MIDESLPQCFLLQMSCRLSFSVMATSEVYDPGHEGDIGKNESQIGEYFDFSKRGYQVLPVGILSKIQNVKFCYLEENFLTSLPDLIFQYMPHLIWLDLRRNNLEALPTVGLAGHANLQTLLLQSNRIKHLPCELANVPGLKGLQIAGNPIENVPFEVVAAGLPAVIKHLRKLAKERNMLLPVSETIIMNSSSQKTLSSITTGRGDENFTRLVIKRQSKQEEKNATVEPLSETLNVKCYQNTKPNEQSSVLQKRKQGFKKECRVRAQISSACQVLSSKGKSHSAKLVTLEDIAMKEKEEYERELLRETLDRQSQMLQRIRDMDAVDHWRKDIQKGGSRKLLDNFQYSPSRNFLDKTPFDVDPDMLQMLRRVDLYKSLREWEEHERRLVAKRAKPVDRITARNVEKHIAEIRSRLSAMNLKEENTKSSEEKKFHLTTRLDEINKLREKLINLHEDNFRTTN